ncbi:MAG: hypothetical protein JWP11_33 [Frankiales bacterium]|nr:hypothetical protein [Frankiales bacterium]
MSAETVAIDLADALRTKLPGMLASGELLALSDTRITWDQPHVVPYQDGLPTVFPAIEVVITDDAVTGHEVADDGTVWDYITYTTRIFGTVHGDDFEDTDRARKRLVVALRNIVRDADLPFTVGRVTRASYSALGIDQRDKRTLGAAYLSLQVTALEPPFSPDPAAPEPTVINTVSVDVDKLDAPDD